MNQLEISKIMQDFKNLNLGKIEICEGEFSLKIEKDVANSIIQTVPCKKIGKPENVAKAIAFLTDESSDYITGQVIAVDGGMSMM